MVARHQGNGRKPRRVFEKESGGRHDSEEMASDPIGESLSDRVVQEKASCYSYSAEVAVHHENEGNSHRV